MQSKAWDSAVHGMNAASSHADRKNPGWTERALEFFTEFAKSHSDGFMMCDVVEASGCMIELTPPDDRAWGSIAVIAKRKGIVEQFGFSYTRKGKSHTSPKAVWKFINQKGEQA